MEIASKSDNSSICQCSKMPDFLHEIAQSVLIIHAYASGCSERLKGDALDNKQLTDIFKKINKHTGIIGEKIHLFKLNGLPL